MTASYFIMDHLSYIDMAGWPTIIFLGIVFLLGFASLKSENNSADVSIIASSLVTLLVGFCVVFIQYESLYEDVDRIKKVETILSQNDELVPNPIIERFQNHKLELVQAMKRNGDFGKYQDIYDSALDVSSIGQYGNKVHDVFYLESIFTVCFGSEPDKDYLNTVRVFPPIIDDIEKEWVKAIEKYGIKNPNCNTKRVIENLYRQ